MTATQLRQHFENSGFAIRRFLIPMAACLGSVLFALPLAAPGAPLARVAGPAAGAEVATFSLHLPLRNGGELDALMSAQASAGSPFYHHWLSRAQFRRYFGPQPALVRQLIATLAAGGLVAKQTGTQMLSVRGPVRDVQRLFATKLSRVVDARGRTRIAALGSYALPPALARSGATLIDLHAGHPLQPLLRLRGAGAGFRPANRIAELGTYWADDLKQAYQFPSYRTLTGKGVNVAFVAGGDFSNADLAQYLGHEKIGSAAGDLAPAPTAVHVLLPGAQGFDPTSVDSGEADLDSQQIAMEAPGATLTGFIMADDSDASFLAAYATIVDANAYDIVSTSYAECELLYTAPYIAGGIDQTGILLAYNDLYRQGNVQGTTFVVGSGDDGALACPEPGYFNNAPTTPPTVYESLLGVSANADLPTVIGVGGGELKTRDETGSLDSTYTTEAGNSDVFPVSDPFGTGNLVTSLFGAGGGISTLFKKPAYQKLIDTGSAMRTVPDVGGHIGRFTDSGSSDFMVFDGQVYGGVLGTSASAPDFAALLALKVEAKRSRLGLENTDIYELAKNNYAQSYHYFHDHNPGNDGYYAYTPQHYGYNYIYGVGSPRGSEFLGLPFAPYAGDPQTASNP